MFRKSAPPLTPLQQLLWLCDNTIKYSPLVAGAGSALTILALASVFGEWGLNFVQLVGAGDLFLTGFVFGVLTLFIPALIWLPAMLIDFGVEKIALAKRPRLLFAIALGLVVAWVVAASGSGPIRSSVQALVAWLALGLAGHILWRPTAYDQHWLGRGFLIVPSVILVLGLTTLWLVVSTERFAAHGFMREVWTAKSDHIPCDGQVMWLGDKATVLRCAQKQNDQWTYIVLGSHDELVLTKAQPKSAASDAAPQIARKP